MLEARLRALKQDFVLDISTELSLNCATAIIGPNGSGKTTLLRSLAGLTSVKGFIRVNDSVWLDSDARAALPVHKRPVGYMSQSPKLLPHLNVRNNLRFAQFLANRKNRQQDGIPFNAVVDSLNIEDLLQRKPTGLSGGEVSRVALAQALICKPLLLMLDEPLASIDVDRKSEFVPYLRSVLKEYRIPMLYVTHSLSEVAALCDRTLVLQDGRIRQEGETTSVLQELHDMDDVSVEFDAVSVIHGEILRHDQEFHLTYLRSCNQELVVPTHTMVEAGDAVRMRIRAKDVSLATAKPEHISIRNILDGEIIHIAVKKEAPHCEIQVKCGGEIIRALVTQASVCDLGLSEGTPVYALIKSVTIEY